MKQWHYFLFTPLFGIAFSACFQHPPNPGLKNARELSVARGYHLARIETHFHGPYSYDACDDHGLNPDGGINLKCLHDLKYALCENHVDLAFLTDHIAHIAKTNFTDLMLSESGDTILRNAAGDAVANQIHCPDGFVAMTAPGLEASLLALGMEKHPSEDWDLRVNTYGSSEPDAIERLERISHAVVGIPHTESRSLADLRKMKPTFIEIYNLHANLHPIIRRDHLKVSPIGSLPKFLKYYVDFFGWLDADYLFMEFLEYFPNYFEKWNALLADGIKLTGVGGLDSHQNVLKHIASDGQRLDSHRRMTRFMSNLAWVRENSVDAVKNAIRDGRVYLVVEGLGSPVGMDFHAKVKGKIIEMGGDVKTNPSVSSSPPSSSLEFSIPHLASDSPGMQSGSLPEIYAELHHIDSDLNNAGKETIVMTERGSQLSYPNPQPGHYRIHVWIIPRHLKSFVAAKGLAETPYQWVISNPIHVIH